jgi:hypothetical protein
MILTTVAPTIAGTINPVAKASVAAVVAGEVVALMAAELVGEEVALMAAELVGEEVASVAADLLMALAAALADLLAAASADLSAAFVDHLLEALEDSAHVILSVDLVEAALDVDSHLCPCHFADHHALEDSIAIVGAVTVIVGVMVATIGDVVAEVVMMKIATTDNDDLPKRMLNFHN